MQKKKKNKIKEMFVLRHASKHGAKYKAFVTSF